MILYTIGFTKKSAERFFESLISSDVRRVIDIRLNNTSQLAAFAKRDDLVYFLRKIGEIDYLHYPQWAPTADMLSGYRKRLIDWEEYERRFEQLLRTRCIQDSTDAGLLDRACLLCSEPRPDRCHRRLVARYLERTIGGLTVCHL